MRMSRKLAERLMRQRDELTKEEMEARWERLGRKPPGPIWVRRVHHVPPRTLGERIRALFS